jgi:hypothetical protein
MVKRKSYSEYDGDGVMPNTVYPVGSDALTPSDKLRLQSITGQEEDSRAPVDPYFWYGNAKPDYTQHERDAQEKKRNAARLEREQRDRYRESPY